MSSGAFDSLWNVPLIFLALLGVIACAFLIFDVLIKYAVAMRAVLVRNQGDPDVVIKPEPAFKQYFLHKAWIDFRCIMTMSSRSSWDQLEQVSNFSDRANRFSLIVGHIILIGAALGVLTAAGVVAVVRLVHLIFVVTASAIAFVLAYSFRLLEYLSLIWRRIFMVCPHAGCYRRIALPVYVCPSCGVQHRNLIPGAYGTFRRKCKCGTWLPTLFLLGRHRLPSHCPHPHCGRPLNKDIGPVRNLHFPIVGGPTAGKSSLLAATMVELSARAHHGALQLEFPEKKDERLFQVCKDAFANGQPVSKTAEYSPNAFMAKITDARGKCALVYAYDAAGELYQGSAELHTQEYYSYIHGIMLVIDPYSLAEVRQEGGGVLASVQQTARPSAEPPEAVYGRMVESVRGFSGQTGRLDRPLAVVLTKTDAPGLREQLHPGGPIKPEDADALVKQWLQKHGESNLVRSIHRDFKDIKYFMCSALGRSPGADPQPFVPVDVLLPFAWLLSHYNLQIDTKQLGIKQINTKQLGTKQIVKAAAAPPVATQLASPP